MRRSTADQRQLYVAHQVRQAALSDLLALPARQRAQQHGVGPGRVLEVAEEPALLAQLRKRIAAPGRVQQVGAEQRVVNQAGRDHLQRLGVVGQDLALPARRDHLGRSGAVSDQHPLTDAGPKAPRRAVGEQRPFGGLDRLHRQTQLARRKLRDLLHRARAQGRAERDVGGARRGGEVGPAERLLQPAQGIAQLVLPEHGAQARAVGLSLGLGRDVEVDGEVAPHGGKRLGQAGIVGVVEQVLFALGAFDVLDVRQHALERAVALNQLAGRLLADPGHTGDVVRGVALQAVEVGNQLRRDAVAVDHGLAVVDLGVGDSARGGHHPDAVLVIDQLKDIAIAGHDHHRNRRVGVQSPLHERRDHVVRLAALDGHVAIAEGLDERLHRRPLLLEQVRARAPLGLVVGQQLRTARAARVPGHERRAHAVLGHDLHEHRREAEDRVGRHSGRRRDRLRQREERAIHEARPVDQEQALRGARRELRSGAWRAGDCAARVLLATIDRSL